MTSLRAVGLDRLRVPSQRLEGAISDAGGTGMSTSEGQVRLEPFRLILGDERFADLPMVIETEKGDDSPRTESISGCCARSSGREVADFGRASARSDRSGAATRDASRLMVLDRGTAGGTTAALRGAPASQRRDLLVVNDTRVFPARLRGQSPPEAASRSCWSSPWPRAAARASGVRCSPVEVHPYGRGDRGRGGLSVVPLAREGDAWRIELLAEGGDPNAAIEAAGDVPLPPYIRRDDNDPRRALDRERYQTVYARVSGAVAAPTAGLHFTPDVFQTLASRGVETAFVTLHVGLGTFAPVRVGEVEAHRMHDEAFASGRPSHPQNPSARWPRRRRRQTVVRTLKRAGDRGGVAAGLTLGAFRLSWPRFRVVDALVTIYPRVDAAHAGLLSGHGCSPRRLASEAIDSSPKKRVLVRASWRVFVGRRPRRRGAGGRITAQGRRRRRSCRSAPRRRKR
jgi:S-adenosylmethionine:tRNA ribosyltransferase-isomerase